MTPVPPPQISKATRREMLDPMNASAIKKYKVYDAGTGKVTDIYYAQKEAIAFDGCLRQQFTYVDTVSGVEVEKESWSNEFWLGPAWDI